MSDLETAPDAPAHEAEPLKAMLGAGFDPSALPAVVADVEALATNFHSAVTDLQAAVAGLPFTPGTKVDPKLIWQALADPAERAKFLAVGQDVVRAMEAGAKIATDVAALFAVAKTLEG